MKRDRDHDCPHPIENYGPNGEDVWVCPGCGRVWEAHTDIYWAPAEDSVYWRDRADAAAAWCADDCPAARQIGQEQR